MRSVTAAALALALAACGSGEGDGLAASNSQLSQAQIDAALGPANQSMEDAMPSQAGQNDLDAGGNQAAAATNEDEQ